MSSASEPIIDQWYSHLDKGQKFQVVALDEHSGDVEVQFFDGTVDFINLEDWAELQIDTIDPPANMAGPLDLPNTDDMGYQTTDLEPDGYRGASEFDVETIAEERRQETE